jgi:hypothetical protein
VLVAAHLSVELSGSHLCRETIAAASAMPMIRYPITLSIDVFITWIM